MSETIGKEYLTVKMFLERVGEREEGRAVFARSFAKFPVAGRGETGRNARKPNAPPSTLANMEDLASTLRNALFFCRSHFFGEC